MLVGVWQVRDDPSSVVRSDGEPEPQPAQQGRFAMGLPSGKDLHFTRDEVVQNLRMWRLEEMAEKAAQELPESFNGDELFAWMGRNGYSRDDLISLMGGSP
jgi:hypothetical protein